MKALILFLVLLSQVAMAKDSISNDRSKWDSEFEEMNYNHMRWRFHIKGDVVVMSADGKAFANKIPEVREWKFGGGRGNIVSYWSLEPKGFEPVALRHTWELTPDKKLKVTFEQFDRFLPGESGSDGGMKVGKLLRKEEKFVENLAMVTWVASQDKKYRLVLRFQPGVWEFQEPESIAGLPVSGRDLSLYDVRKGQIWAMNFKADAKYVGVVTHRGSLFLSYEPFPGAKEIGTAKYNQITVQPEEGMKLRIQGSTQFLPRDTVGKVYGIYNPNVKTPHLHSVKTFSSTEEDHFLSVIKSL